MLHLLLDSGYPIPEKKFHEKEYPEKEFRKNKGLVQHGQGAFIFKRDQLHQAHTQYFERFDSMMRYFRKYGAQVGQAFYVPFADSLF